MNTATTTSKPSLHVIVPCYNAASTVGATLRCLYDELSGWFSLKLIVVDDGSTDNSREIVRELRQKVDCLALIEKPNGGVSSARNAGYQYVTSTGGVRMVL